MASIFISHAHIDQRLAERLHGLLKDVSGGGFNVYRSSEKGAIKSGENWRAWIDDNVLGCDVAIVLLTPSSFRGRWVLWESGAVAGVQYERIKDANLSSDDPKARRVRVLRFGLDNQDLGPFGSQQSSNGLDEDDVVKFMSDLLFEYKDDLREQDFKSGFTGLERNARSFVTGAKEDLRRTPIYPTEGVVQEWLDRLDEAHERNDDAWIVAATRWINVAFLGSKNADAHTKGEAVDFRIHMRIAEAHKRLGQWPDAIQQLELAASLSPNDLVVLRELGRAYRETKDMARLQRIMEQMEELDPEIFRKDREGVALRCGYFAKLEQWTQVDELLSNADERLVARDNYLANWRAIACMKAQGPEKSKPLFQQLRRVLTERGKGFWDDATLVNALLALDEQDHARELLKKLDLPNQSKDDVASASRFYDEIIESFGHEFDWKAAAGLS